MVKIDLITGFLGSGKTTFIKKYAQYLLDKGYKIGILENDFGAINVDMMLLQDLMGQNCELEMVSSGYDEESHRRRFKTKLIAMSMTGNARVIVEPSGIYDVDSFFDVLCEDPLDKWYEIGNVITVVDAGLDNELSEQAEYLLASQLAQAGRVILSKTEMTTHEQISSTINHLNRIMEKFHCERRFGEELGEKGLGDLQEKDFEQIEQAGYADYAHTKLWFEKDEAFNSLYFMNIQMEEERLKKTIEAIMQDNSCGKVFRIKGFMQMKENEWIEINATHEQITIRPIEKGQNVLIVIGEKLVEEKIKAYFDEAVKG